MFKILNYKFSINHNSIAGFIKAVYTLKSLILLFAIFNICTVSATTKLQQDDLKKIDQLVQEADDLKFKSDSLGFLKIIEAEKLATKLQNDRKLGEIYTMYGILYFMKGTYDLSLGMYLKAIPIHEKYNNDKFLARSLNGVGLIQSGFNQLNEAINTFQKCLAIDIKNNNHLGIARSYFNISLAQIELKEYDNATQSLKKALLSSKKINVEESNHMIESKLGDIMRIRNKPDSAFYFYNTLLKSVSPVPNNWEKTYAYIGMAQTYLVLKDFDNAEKYGLLSFKYGKENNADADVARIAKVLSEVYEKKGNPIKAYEFLKISNRLSEEIYNEKKLNDINYIQLKGKEIENLKLLGEAEQTIQEAKRNRIIIYSFVALSLFLLGIIFLVRRNARLKEVFNRSLQLKSNDIESQKKLITRQNQDLMRLNESKNQLFSIISHDLRTPLNSILQTLELQKDNSFSPELQSEIFDQLHLQTQSTSKMLNHLLNWANTQMDGQKINFEEINITILIESIIEFYKMEIANKRINLIHENSEFNNLIKADIGQVRIIIQNILANAIKFTPENGTITFLYSQTTDFVNIHIINTGKKLSRERVDQMLNMNKRMTSEDGTAFEDGTGLGLLLVKQFLANNKGMFDLKSTDEFGTELIISFLKN